MASVTITPSQIELEPRIVGSIATLAFALALYGYSRLVARIRK
jgi:hypothetical protein